MKTYLKSVLAAVATMLFMSIYTTVDGMYLAKCVSTDAMAAINIVYPIVNVMFAIGFGLAAGGSTRIAAAIGEGKPEEADKRFTILISLGLLLSAISMVLLFWFLDPLLRKLGATSLLIDYCRIYARIAIISYPIGILKEILAAVMRTQKLELISMISSITGGVINIVLDALFIKTFELGIRGAAIATLLGMAIALLINVLSLIQRGKLHFCKVRKQDFTEVLSIEKLSRASAVMELSYAITIWLFNHYALQYGGEGGVAAYTVIGYVQYALAAVFIGIGLGLAPYVSIAYGENKQKVKKILPFVWKYSLVAGVFVTIAGHLCAGQLAGIFLNTGTNVFMLAQRGISIIAFSCIPMGFNSSCSTILNACEAGKEATIITALRTVVFLVAGAWIFTKLLELEGIWVAYVMAEAVTILVSIVLYKKYLVKRSMQ